MIFLYWLAGFVLSLLGAEIFVRIARWTVKNPTQVPLRRTIPFSLLFSALSMGPLFLAAMDLLQKHTPLYPLLPAAALAGWMACWARGLEWFIDRCYPDRILPTSNIREVTWTPFGVLLLGIYQLSPSHSALDTILICASLLPMYLIFSVALVRRAFPAVAIDKTILSSVALRFGIGFAVIGLISWTILTFIPLARQHPEMAFLWFLLPYAFGTSLEGQLTRKLQAKTLPVTQKPETSLPALTRVAEEETPRLHVGRH
jgi:hypothetical protein